MWPASGNSVAGNSAVLPAGTRGLPESDITSRNAARHDAGTAGCRPTNFDLAFFE
jgi:hypothetical protein